ncbi:ATP-binding protein [Halobacterium salinarum]|uniref:ATP-binding protein n=1 Tax=Halobacterium salinarum TaxID=2242 RepID=UPI002553C0CF|nr:ATP-binding protein [Halobacterium salinarum]MDL0132063.1 ATP-binding protein [Halobacterium salinarum]
MQERLYPSSVDEWDVETLEGLVEHSVAEDQYLEYKQYLRYPDHREPEPSKSEWRKDIEREFAAFANASGGVILFGMSDDIEYNPIEEPENEIGRHVIRSSLVENPVAIC